MNARDLADRLREAVRGRADQLDGGIFSPPWVKALSADEEVAAWESVLHDSEVLADHKPQEDAGGGDPRCVADGDRFPCAEVARLASVYGLGGSS